MGPRIEGPCSTLYLQQVAKGSKIKETLSLSLSIYISNNAKLLVTRHVQSYVPGIRPARIPLHIIINLDKTVESSLIDYR